MTGMFQSSRMASGSPRLQTSSAFSPSSASTIWKSRPSRIRLATFRMTLESSTTRHVFIFGLYSTLRYPEGRSNNCSSCRHHVGRNFENPIDVENDHQLAIEAVYSAGKLGHARVEVDGVFLPALVGKPEHFPDLID